jgi:vacuolar iron transporter family protein
MIVRQKAQWMHARFPAAEQAEPGETIRGYGADPDTAARMAAVSRDRGHRAAVHTREEPGVYPLGLPSAILAGRSSLVAFSLGALVPLLPNHAGAAGITSPAPLISSGNSASERETARHGDSMRRRAGS